MIKVVITIRDGIPNVECADGDVQVTILDRDVNDYSDMLVHYDDSFAFEYCEVAKVDAQMTAALTSLPPVSEEDWDNQW